MDAAAARASYPTWGQARSVDNYEKLEVIGEGTYGEVRGCVVCVRLPQRRARRARRT